MNFLSSFSVIFAGLGSGYAFKSLVDRKIVDLSADGVEKLRGLLQRTALLGINPVAFCAAIWAMDLGNPGYLALPVAGTGVFVFGGLLGLAGSKLLRLPPERAGVYVTCSSFINIGNIGGLVVFTLCGEKAFALVPFFKLFEELWYYTVLFPLARRYGLKARSGRAAEIANPGFLSDMMRVAKDPFFFVAVSGISLGLALNLSGIPRPPFLAGLTGITVPVSSFMLLFAIGIRMRFDRVLMHLREAGLLVFCKALLVPAFGFLIATVLGLGAGDGGLGIKVVLILSAMPVAFLGLVPPTLYRLDVDFANVLWLVSNASLLLIIPVLSFLVRMIA